MTSYIHGSLLGIAIGDAIGLPWECTVGYLTLKGFEDNPKRKISDTKNLPLGATSDDTDLTIAVLKSLIRSKGFNLTDQALSHVEAIEKSTFGYGKGTKKNLLAIKQYFDSRGKEGRSPLIPAPIEYMVGAGNGVAMKTAPIGLFRGLQNLQNLQRPDFNTDNYLENTLSLSLNTLALGELTHTDFEALIAGDIIGRLISIIIMSNAALFINPAIMMKLACENLAKISLKYGIENSKIILELLIQDIINIENVLQHNGRSIANKNSFLNRLKMILTNDLLTAPIEKVMRDLGNGFLAIDSVPLAICIALRHPNNFQTAILEALNHSFDRDTVCSMVGGIVGANVGKEGIPVDWVNFSPEFKVMEDLGTQLFNLFQ